jgi:hypothetical protein
MYIELFRKLFSVACQVIIFCKYFWMDSCGLDVHFEFPYARGSFFI